MLTVTWAGEAIGWYQWYRWADYPVEAMGACEGDLGIVRPVATEPTDTPMAIYRIATL